MDICKLYTIIASIIGLFGIIFFWAFISKPVKQYAVKIYSNMSGYSITLSIIIVLNLFFSVINTHNGFKGFLNDFLHGVSGTCGAISFFMVLYLIIILFKRIPRKDIFRAVTWICFVTFLAFPNGLRNHDYGNTQIGSFWEKLEYFENYYVEISDTPPGEHYQTFVKLPRSYT